MASVGWLAHLISIAAILLWLLILQQNPVRAAFWIFLCPVIGFMLAAILLHEPLTCFTAIGVLLVVSGLYLGQRYA
jgi:drug/metabolite transporter (DMT)-like permease